MLSTPRVAMRAGSVLARSSARPASGLTSRVALTAPRAASAATQAQVPSFTSVHGARFYSDEPQKQSLPFNWGVRVVPETSAWIVERFGKFSKVLEPGLHFLIPFVDRISYVHSLKETAIKIRGQYAITQDNVTIGIDGVLYVKVIEPKLASYGVSDAIFAITQLAQTTMRSELGKMSLDRTFAERESLNAAIVQSINEASKAWGIHCLRYEIRDIIPPRSVKAAMDLQAEAERRKRAEILESEGSREAAINTARGARERILLQAQGEAAGILARAQATASGVRTVAKALNKKGGSAAVTLRVAEQYIDAFSKLAKKGTTLVVPANANDPTSMVAQAMSIYKSLSADANPEHEETDDEDEAQIAQNASSNDRAMRELMDSFGSEERQYPDADLTEGSRTYADSEVKSSKGPFVPKPIL